MSSIHRLFKCASSYMFHVDQSWCIPWHDLVGVTTLKLMAKGINSWWQVNLVHDNQHTFIKTNFFFTKTIIALARDLECWMNPFSIFLSMYSWSITSSFCVKLQMGPNGGCTPSLRSMVQLYGQYLNKVFTFFFSNTYLNSWY